MLKEKRYREIAGVIIILTGILVFLALVSYNASDYKALQENGNFSNLIGPIGAWAAHYLRTGFGYAAFIFIIMVICGGWYYLTGADQDKTIERIFAAAYMLITISAFLALTDIGSEPAFNGGFIGLYFTQFFRKITGSAGAWLIVLILNVVGLIFFGIISMESIFNITVIRGERVAMFFKKIISKKDLSEKSAAPQNRIDQELNAVHDKKRKKAPWITKEKVFVKIKGEYNRTEPEKDSPVLVELPDFSKSNMRSREEEPLPFIPEFELSVDNSNEVAPVYTTMPLEMENSNQNFQIEKVIMPEIAHTPQDTVRPGQENRLRITDIESCNNNPHPDEYKSEISSSVAVAERVSEEEKAEELVEAALEEQENNEERKIQNGNHVFKEDKHGTDDNGYDIRDIPINDDYIIPMHFLNKSDKPDKNSWRQEIKHNSDLLVKTLDHFGIESKVVNVNRGPVITLYELQIAPGIKVNRIAGLADDIAMALAASRVRIVAPIPGKSAVGVEIPNVVREMVRMGDIVATEAYQKASMILKVGLGKDILGYPVMLDLKKLPHLLIAGATGSGKSVCVNTIITSLLYNYDPNKIRFIMVDPKMVELQLYNGLPHQLTPVITEPDMAPKALKWAIYEMERRYQLLSELNTRDIERYNHKILSYKGDSGLKTLPYIVIIVDELADLMMVAPKEIENYITRIAQKARAVGIHLVLATQRPSVDVITGIIKANFPARIAFQVAQKTDSRTIIDQNGAEKLLGKGDLLYVSPMSSFPVRIQGALVAEDEIVKVVRYARKFGDPHYIDIEGTLAAEEEKNMENVEDEDELFVEALEIVETTKKASASFLQRRLSIGYNRAARMVERMEELGYVGPPQGSKPREVLI